MSVSSVYKYVGWSVSAVRKCPDEGSGVDMQGEVTVGESTVARWNSSAGHLPSSGDFRTGKKSTIQYLNNRLYQPNRTLYQQ